MGDLTVVLPDQRQVACAAAKSRGVVFGRDAACDVVLSDPRVSSRHLAVFSSDPQGTSWFVNDLNSRHGVTVNGTKVAVGAPVLIRAGDWIGAGPVMLRVGDRARGERQGCSAASWATLFEGPVSRVATPAAVMPGLSDLQHISRISAAQSREELYTELLTCVMAITGYARAVIAQVCGGVEAASVEVVASRTASSSVAPVESISRSLVRTAVGSGAAVYDETGAGRVGVVGGSAAEAGASIVLSFITGACCIRLSAASSQSENGVAIVLYMDSRGREARPRAGSVEIASALASVAAACLGRLNAAELEQRHASLELELRSARVLQEQLLPPAKGAMLGGALRYALLSLPGRVVAGDIVDIMELDERRVAVVLGDVMGKGAAAGMLMSAVQARLSQGLLDGVPLQDLLDRVNKDTCVRCPGMMVSLWVGVIDVGERRLSYIDAGHGMALHRRAGEGEGATELISGGGMVLGGAEDSVYEVAAVELRAGDRVLLYTDGIAEQPDLRGIEFSVERVRACFERPLTALEHLPDLHTTMVSHANGAVQRDDITAIVLEYEGGER